MSSPMAPQDGRRSTVDVLLVGVGGVGTPAAIALAAAGMRRMRAVDDDWVELTNLHRQILFREEDVGRPKLDAFAARLGERFPGVIVETVAARATPDTVMDLVSDARVVVDATDNFASRFLLADACLLAGRPVVHAAAVRWQATVIACAPSGGPCYRCLFEDLPTGDAPDCATAGVAGPVCGVSGALAADLALRILEGDASAFGHIATYDGRRDMLRSVRVAARPGCPLCGERRNLRSIEAARYEGPSCSSGAIR